MKSLNIRFVDCPPHFQAPSSLYRKLIESAAGGQVTVVTDPRRHVDLEIVSNHASERRRLMQSLLRTVPGASYRRRLRSVDRWSRLNASPTGRASISLWVTGENARPPVGQWDAYLSFDLDSYGGRNIYFPHWWEYCGILGSRTHNYLGRNLDLVEMATRRTTSQAEQLSTRRQFACAFVGNPIPIRFHVIEQLNRVGPVDVYGAAVGKKAPTKLEIASNYRYVICLENDLYPGYVTEKPFDAWSTGAIPIWWGSDPAGYINESSLLNLAKFDSIRSLVAHVESLEIDNAARVSILREPILTRPPEWRAVIRKLRSLLDLG